MLVDIDYTNLVEDVLKGTYIAVMGRSPGKGGYRPNGKVLRELLVYCSNDREKVMRYVSDAMLAHIYYEATEGQDAQPFFVNSLLMSEALMEFIEEQRSFLRKRYGSLLDRTDTYHNTVFADILHGEKDYLPFAYSAFCSDKEIPWDIISPTVNWGVMVYRRVAGMDPGRYNQKAPPPLWDRRTVRYQKQNVPVISAIRTESRRLIDKEVRDIWSESVRRGIYEARKSYCLCAGLIQVYTDNDGKCAISREFSKIPRELIEDISFPLVESDHRLFEAVREHLGPIYLKDYDEVSFPTGNRSSSLAGATKLDPRLSAALEETADA